MRRYDTPFLSLTQPSVPAIPSTSEYIAACPGIYIYISGTPSILEYIVACPGIYMFSDENQN